MSTNRPEINIRPARPSDSKELAAFDKRLAREPDISIPFASDEVYTVEDYEERLRKIGTPPNTTWFVAEAQGKIVATLSCHSGRLRAFSHAIFLGVSVDKQWRSMGIGTRLMKTAISWAEAQGLKRIELRVYAENHRALKLYERLGFKTEGLLKGAIHQHGRYIDEVVMALMLPEDKAAEAD